MPIGLRDTEYDKRIAGSREAGPCLILCLQLRTRPQVLASVSATTIWGPHAQLH